MTEYIMTLNISCIEVSTQPNHE